MKKHIVSLKTVKKAMDDMGLPLSLRQLERVRRVQEHPELFEKVKTKEISSFYEADRILSGKPKRISLPTDTPEKAANSLLRCVDSGKISNAFFNEMIKIILERQNS
jgi:hypothetical protein